MRYLPTLFDLATCFGDGGALFLGLGLVVNWGIEQAVRHWMGTAQSFENP